MTVLQGRSIHRGVSTGKTLVTEMPISFFGGVDPDSGVVVEKGHELEGTCVSGRVLVFPHGRGSTVGSYILYRMVKAGVAPAAVVNRETEAIVAVGCIISGIPCVDQIRIESIPAGVPAKVDGGAGIVELE